AVLLEPLSVVEKAVFQAWKIQERLVWQPKRAVVLGAGTIGVLAAILLRLRGLEVHVYATTPEDDDRARLVGSLGAAYHDVNRHPLAGLAEELGQSDYILEATGVSSVAFEATGAVQRLPLGARPPSHRHQDAPDDRRLGGPAAAAGDQVRDQSGPAGLVRRAQPGSGLAVEVLVEGNQAVPARIAVEPGRASVDRAPPAVALAKERHQPVGQVVRDLAQRTL